MKTIYSVYAVAANVPMVRDRLKAGCSGEGEIFEETIKNFDTETDALNELKKHMTLVYPRVECRKAYYEVKEWVMDKIEVDDSGNELSRKKYDFAEMDLSELNDDEDYMP